MHDSPNKAPPPFKKAQINVEHTGPFFKPAVQVSVTTFVTDAHLQQNNVINYRHGQSTVQTQSIKRKEC